MFYMNIHTQQTIKIFRKASVMLKKNIWKKNYKTSPKISTSSYIFNQTHQQKF